MTVAKKGKKYRTVHCHGAKASKTIATFNTKEEALSQHRAIQASKAKKKK